MSQKFADLHIHTVFSDGQSTPEEIVQLAKQNNLQAIAISDHDTFGALERAKACAGDDLMIIPAVELSTEQDQNDIHILAYFVDHNNTLLAKEVEAFRETRTTRAKKMVQKLNELMNIPIDYALVLKFAGSGAVGRPHIARALIDMKVTETFQEAFTKYLGVDSPAYFPKHKITPQKAIELIKQAGGIPVWAHPGTNQVDHMLEDFVSHGLMGIEAYHYTHYVGESIDHYIHLANKFDLLITGGSDFHGKATDHYDPEFGVTKADFDRLMNKYNSLSKLK
ncbi:MAG: PHP domain-containing protein [Bacteriovoracaceae bacterium]|nr:PHP domain-containing protein [Bacteriovoracaceae bacterium]